MDIDLQALRALERERDVSLDVLIPAIESAVLQAYLRTDDHYPNARAELDRKSGHVVIWAREAYEVTEEVPVIADPDAEGDEDEAASSAPGPGCVASSGRSSTTPRAASEGSQRQRLAR